MKAEMLRFDFRNMIQDLTPSHSPFSLLPQSNERDIFNSELNSEKQKMCFTPNDNDLR